MLKYLIFDRLTRTVRPEVDDTARIISYGEFYPVRHKCVSLETSGYRVATPRGSAAGATAPDQLNYLSRSTQVRLDWLSAAVAAARAVTATEFAEAP